MFLNIIMGFVMIVMSISLFATYQSAGTPKKNILLGITLPKEYIINEKVTDIIKNYKKINRLLFLVSLILALPLFTLKYTSFIILYLFLWYLSYFLVSNVYFKKYNKQLFLLKSQNRWFPDEWHIVTEDTDKEPIYADEDECWRKGYYYNPKDSRSTVEKRVGVGNTYNMATKKGKAITYSLTSFGIIVVGAVLFLFARMDFATFDLTLEGSTVEMRAPFYGYQFDINEIENVSLIDSMPQHGVRSNGAATETYSLGNFNYDGYGRSKVYIYNDYPPYILIKTKDLSVFFNSKEEGTTREYYEMLLKKLEIKK